MQILRLVFLRLRQVRPQKVTVPSLSRKARRAVFRNSMADIAAAPKSAVTGLQQHHAAGRDRYLAWDLLDQTLREKLGVCR